MAADGVAKFAIGVMGIVIVMQSMALVCLKGSSAICDTGPAFFSSSSDQALASRRVGADTCDYYERRCCRFDRCEDDESSY